ncbi:MAG: hypothetical protein C0394_11750 [Syntrophus sp. (in: bacteria)]|nr:hypothetical protein [Syntrophus sp. (in: bacteria)]
MEPEEKTEEQLAAELEAMYKRVASIEKPGEADDQRDEIQAHQWHEDRMPASSMAGAVVTAGSNAAEIPLQPPAPEGGRRRLMIPAALAVVCGCVLLYGAFFWPTLYELSLIHTGGKMYPLRINRITGIVVYFDGEQWRSAPVPASEAPVPAPPVPVATAPAPEAPVSAAAAPVSAAPLAAQPAILPQQEASQDRRQRPAPASAHAQTQAAFAQQARQTPPRGVANDKLFAIQIKSFDNPAEASKLVEDLRKAGMETDSVAASVGARGIWNRVLIGRFKNQNEALKFMHEHKIKDAYPGSFIQKRSP